MTRHTTHAPKIVGRVYQAPSKMIVPDPIDDGPPRKAIVGINDPIRQSGAADPFVIEIFQLELGLESGNQGKRAGLNKLTWSRDLTPLQEMNGSRHSSGRMEIASVSKIAGSRVDHLRWGQLRQLLVDLGQLLLHVG